MKKGVTIFLVVAVSVVSILFLQKKENGTRIWIANGEKDTTKQVASKKDRVGTTFRKREIDAPKVGRAHTDGKNRVEKKSDLANGKYIGNISMESELMRIGYGSDIFERLPGDLRMRELTLKESLEAIGGRVGDPVFIRIFKKESVLELWMKRGAKYRLLKSYPICKYSGELGPKLKEGDGQSPEGFYRVYRSSLNPESRFHLSFNLGYPNSYDRQHGRSGSYLMVHGNCVSIGCYAMTDEKIEEIYKVVEGALKRGQSFVSVHIFPFRMSVWNMNENIHNRWYDFWQNLKEGYDYFEKYHIPPDITAKNGRYIIKTD